MVKQTILYSHHDLKRLDGTFARRNCHLACLHFSSIQFHSACTTVTLLTVVWDLYSCRVGDHFDLLSHDSLDWLSIDGNSFVVLWALKRRVGQTNDNKWEQRCGKIVVNSSWLWLDLLPSILHFDGLQARRRSWRHLLDHRRGRDWFLKLVQQYGR